MIQNLKLFKKLEKCLLRLKQNLIVFIFSKFEILALTSKNLEKSKKSRFFEKEKVLKGQKGINQSKNFQSFLPKKALGAFFKTFSISKNHRNCHDITSELTHRIYNICSNKRQRIYSVTESVMNH